MFVIRLNKNHYILLCIKQPAMEIFRDENQHELLRFNNELKKIKLSVEYGADFPFEVEGLPPEIESQWLDHMLELEEAFSNRKIISVYEKIGCPAYKRTQEITGEELKTELKRLIDILFRNEIVVDTLCEVEDRILYQFIIHDLFNEEIDDIPVRGIVTYFIYEDFYPNDELDVSEACHEAVHMIFNKENEFYLDFLFTTEQMEVYGMIINSDVLLDRITGFRKKHKSFEITHFNITSLDIENAFATVGFYISYLGLLHDGCGKKLYFGVGGFELRKEPEGWIFTKIDLPGLK